MKGSTRVLLAAWLILTIITVYKIWIGGIAYSGPWLVIVVINCVITTSYWFLAIGYYYGSTYDTLSVYKEENGPVLYIGLITNPIFWIIRLSDKYLSD